MRMELEVPGEDDGLAAEGEQGVLVARGIPVRLSPGSPMNIKITTPIDLEMAQVLVQRMS